MADNGVLSLAARDTTPSSPSSGYTNTYVTTSGCVCYQNSNGKIQNMTSRTEKIAVIPINSSIALSGSEVNYMRIPASMNGWIMTSTEASSSGSPSSGSAIFRVSKISASSIDSGSVVMLTSNIYIDEGTFDSSSASAARRPAISTSASAVWTGDKIKVYTIACATNVTYAQVSLSFRDSP